MTHHHMPRPGRIGLALTAVLVSAGTAIAATSTAGGATTQRLVGTFQITKGSCAKGVAHGSYFRMIYPGGNVTTGKFFANPDSACASKTYTLISPGSAGGLVTGKFQPAPSPAFDSVGNSRAGAISAPQAFTAIKFGLVTTPSDASSGKSLPAPSITQVKGKLSGDLRAFTANWNKLAFNQGSPKPDGTRPGRTTAVTGTYNAKTRAFVLIWASAVVGGPFNGFTGSWHLEGTFRPAK